MSQKIDQNSETQSILNKRRYSQINNDTRRNFINRVLSKEVTIKQVNL